MILAEDLLDWKFFAQLLVTFSVGAGGWVAVHWLASKRDAENERRKIINSFLLEAYRRLESASNRDEDSDGEHIRSIESAIADIQLLGSRAQINLIIEFTNQLELGEGALANKILFSLRETLRKEMKLESTSKPIKIVRMKNAKASASQ